MSRVIQFSQESLKDYVDCPRRYQLRHLLAQRWPAILSGSPREAEDRLLRGTTFHHLVHQYYSGIDSSCLLQEASSDPVVHRWWATFLLNPPPDLPVAFRHAEAIVSAPVAGHRLIARFDLLAFEPGVRAVVVDWKTEGRRPVRSSLTQRMQTRVYRYLLAATVTENRYFALEADQTEMLYWFCEHGGVTERFLYSSKEMACDEEYLAGLVRQITSCDEETWPLTDHDDRCRYCSYSSLCDRGVGKGHDIEATDTDGFDPDMDVEQIAEVVSDSPGQY